MVSRKSNDEVFHNQIGYWTWDPETGVIAQSLVIPRLVAVLAGGNKSPGVLRVEANRGDPDWGIIESPFMRDRPSTLSIQHRIELGSDEMHYAETTNLSIYGREFSHTDENRLTRVR